MYADWITEKTLETVLKNELRVFVRDSALSASARASPRFWNSVFESYYKRKPVGDNDPAWDLLIIEGYPIIQKLLDH